MPDLILLIQAFFKMLNFLTEKIIHFKLFLYNCLQFLDIRVNIEVYIPNSLNFGNQLTLLSQQFCILLYCCHMGREDLLLLFQNVCNLLLEGKILLSNIIILNSRLHDVNILLSLSSLLSQFLLLYFLLLLNLFLNKFFIFIFAIDSITLNILFVINLR